MAAGVEDDACATARLNALPLQHFGSESRLSAMDPSRTVSRMRNAEPLLGACTMIARTAARLPSAPITKKVLPRSIERMHSSAGIEDGTSRIGLTAPPALMRPFFLRMQVICMLDGGAIRKSTISLAKNVGRSAW